MSMSLVSALLELQSFHDLFREPHLDIIVDARRLRNLTSSHDFLRRLDKFSKPYKRIILNLSSPEAYQSILNQIVDVGMNRDNYHYILFGPYIDSLDLRSFLYGGVNVTGFRLRIDPERIKSFYPNTPSSTMDSLGNTNVSIDTALAIDGLHLVATTLNRMLATREEHEVFKKTFRHGELYNRDNRGVQCWARPPHPWIHGPVIRQWLLKTTVQGVTGQVQLDHQGARAGYSLDVMQLEYRTPLRRVGNWTRDMGVVTNMTRPKPPRVLLDANRTRHENPFVMKKCPKADGSPCTGNDRFEGYCVDLLQKVAEIVGFDYDIHLVYDGKYGTKQADGSWNGMIGELLSGQADLAIASLTITEVRERFVDFSKPFMDLGTSIMIKKPDKEKGGVFSFKNPLSDGVWIAIIMGFIGVSLVLFFVGRFSPYEWDTGAPEAFLRGEPIESTPLEFGGVSPRRRNGSFRDDVDTLQVPRRQQADADCVVARPAFSLANTVWFSLGALMQQGSDIYPRSISGRIVGSAWWFFTLIIISSYTANLAAFLTIERMEIPIDSADDLVRQTEIRYGIIANGSTEEFFKVSNVTVYSKMWAFMANAEPSVFVNTTLAGVERVRNEKGKYAFLLDSSFNDYHNQRKPCNTMKVGRNLDNKGYGIATPRGSDLRFGM
ncbi:glutamate receptor [Elysia marginata]|uniref:Glutamate receptor n=1 Tax=Elysia marginata TaxID=1093978 RepID=A0AAV4I397_9GAST|nr:glutamate receptor [Elysia marginata]